jgi:outer membrane protein OmpA-like peptidoglycan-associated protein
MQYHLIKHFLMLLLLYAASSAKAQLFDTDTSARRLAYLDKLAATDACIFVLDEVGKLKKNYPTYIKTIPIEAKALFQTKDYEGVVRLLKPIAKNNSPLLDAHSRYLYAISLYRTGNLEECLKQCIAFERMRQRFDINKFNTIKSIRRNIEWRPKLDTINSPFVIDSNYAFPNSAYADFSPWILNDSTILFSSLRSDSLVTHKLYQANFSNIEIYRYTVSEAGWDEITRLKSINKLGYETANGSYSPDGKEFYFSRCNFNNEGKRFCKIYNAHIGANGEFQKIKPLPEYINKAKYSQSQPMIHYTRINGRLSKVLFFVSNRKGGFGNNDIWYAVWSEKKKRFSRPINLGQQINTVGNEGSPYYDSLNYKFYFSSDGHPGFGGMDIFSTSMKDMAFKELKNMGQPINSAGDDHYFIISPDAYQGFFASNRAGANQLNDTYCCEDIFRFVHKNKLTKPKKPEIAAQPIEPIASLEPMKELNTPEFSNEEVKIRPIPAMVNDSKGSDSISTAKLMHISRMLTFQFNSSKLESAALPFLDSLALYMKQNKKRKLQLTGHTDDVGTDEYNMNLSKVRVETVALLLRLRGVAPERIESTYRGMRQPLLPNRNADGSPNAYNQAQNRRVTIVVDE